MAKRSMVDLDEDDEEEEQSRQVSRWTREEEILLYQCWFEVFENNNIGADRNEDSFLGQVMEDFNQGTFQGTRTKDMLTGKWENEVDHTENAKTNFMAQSKGRKFLLEHACRVLKNHPKWDVPKPLDADDHTEIFKPDVRPRPIGKPRPAKKAKSEMTESSGGSASGSILESLSKDLRRKLQAPEYAYKAKKEKEMAYTECKELKFLMIDVDALSEPKASIIRKKQEKIMPKYNQE
ncbi:hypothetical protein Tco_0734263 [Tanacetum coccineum]